MQNAPWGLYKEWKRQRLTSGGGISGLVLGVQLSEALCVYACWYCEKGPISEALRPFSCSFAYVSINLLIVHW
jgi:hypothetical protein